MQKKIQTNVHPDNWKVELAKKANTTPDNITGVSVCKEGLKVITKKPVRTIR